MCRSLTYQFACGPSGVCEFRLTVFGQLCPNMDGCWRSAYPIGEVIYKESLQIRVEKVVLQLEVHLL
jgi:hypothetical protein